MTREWIQAKYQPKEAGTYLVTTCNGKLMLDRWDGETWGRCNLRNKIDGTHPGYSNHRAWMVLPPAYEETE